MGVRVAVAAAAALWATAAAAGYDDRWYEMPYWPGEYADGFTLTEDVTVDIRREPDPDLARTVLCEMRAGATYHPWNLERVEADGLEFRSYSLIAEYEVAMPIDALLYRQSDGEELVVALAPGQRWEYLAYMAEGFFFLRLDGDVYQAGQDVIEASKELGPGAEAGRSPDQWLKLTCANGATGWLLLGDVAGAPGFDAPEITNYGNAADRE